MKTILFKTGISFLVIGLLSGCAPKASIMKGNPTRSELLLDTMLTDPEVRDRVAAVERNLPGDIWVQGPPSRPGSYNSSRSGREIDLAYELLEELKPRLTGMSSGELLAALKTFPHVTPSFSGVAYFWYRDANAAIIRELSSRSRTELEGLQRFENDERKVFTGDAGPPLTIGSLIRSSLLPGQ